MYDSLIKICLLETYDEICIQQYEFIQINLMR